MGFDANRIFAFLLLTFAFREGAKRATVKFFHRYAGGREDD
jgi:hypothetical protein